MKISEMPHEKLMEMMRLIGPEIGRLVRRGDKFAIPVYKRYLDVHADPSDPKKRHEFHVALEDYLKRELMIHERTDLGSKFGHLLDEKERPLFVVPEKVSKQ